MAMRGLHYGITQGTNNKIGTDRHQSITTKMSIKMPTVINTVTSSKQSDEWHFNTSIYLPFPLALRSTKLKTQAQLTEIINAQISQQPVIF